MRMTSEGDDGTNRSSNLKPAHSEIKVDVLVFYKNLIRFEIKY
jgi:hypothetical protein